MIAHPIPVTLLTGFPGAGKTTLLNRLPRDPASGRIAVVVNEFGEAGLGHDLIEKAAEDVVLRPVGCICCSIRGELSRTLISLLARRTRGELSLDPPVPLADWPEGDRSSRIVAIARDIPGAELQTLLALLRPRAAAPPRSDRATVHTPGRPFR